MRLTECSPGTRILAFGGYQPATVVTNDDLAATVETTDEWIRSRVGIASRRIAGPDETVADMAVQAGGKALAASGLSTADVDLVIVATCTPEVQIPNLSASVAKRLGIVAPGAYDLNAACAGFCYALRDRKRPRLFVSGIRGRPLDPHVTAFEVLVLPDRRDLLHALDRVPARSERVGTVRRRRRNRHAGLADVDAPGAVIVLVVVERGEVGRQPRHPLVAKSYFSIGCIPCTSPVRPGEDPRAGRWRGSGKVECGLHTLPLYAGLDI